MQTGFARKSNAKQIIQENIAIEKGFRQKKICCCLFMDLSKAFEMMNHDLLLAKLKVYGFSDFPQS